MTFYKGDNFFDFLFTFPYPFTSLCIKFLLGRDLLKKEEACSLKEQILTYLRREAHRFLTEFPPQQVYPFLFTNKKRNNK